jgi:hypothetical protein
LCGSSLHSPYCFSQVEPIDTDLAIVHGLESRVEHLRPGMVRRIDSGSRGLIHSLDSIFKCNTPDQLGCLHGQILPSSEC